jgi:5-methylcytosine-specific restriction protein A
MTRRTAPRQEKDELGRRLCRVPECKALVPKGRLSYCSKACATAFEIAYFPSAMRRHVFARDNGVCALCRCDTELLRRVLRHAQKARHRDVDDDSGGSWRFGRGAKLFREVALELGFNRSSSRGAFWQADHVHEVARGGWGCGLEKLRTLCTPCHKAETARLARELAAERKKAKLERVEAPLFDGTTTEAA